jgi:NADPH oxidase
MPETTEIQFVKPSMKYKPGQWLFINCPTVSRHQWHPFTITSCPFDPYVSIHVRQLGDFTRDLADALGAGPTQEKMYEALDPNGMFEIALEQGQDMPKLCIDGPYGAPAEDVFDNEVAVLIGTGIGVTPFASVMKHIWHLRSDHDRPTRLKRVEFIWICRDTNNFAWFQALLNSLEQQSLEEASGQGEDFLRIHTYLTKNVDYDMVNNIVIHSVGTDRDPLTELRTRTNFGRPNFGRLLSGMRDGIEAGTYMPNLGEDGKERGKTQVGVYFCGPAAAARTIKKSCAVATSDKVKFKFWKEHF